jgi:hypothetical protein
LTRGGAGDTIPGVRAPFLVFGATIVIVAACGARSELYVEQFPHRGPDAGPDVEDAGPDVEDSGPDVVDAPPDSPTDAPPDVVVPPECADAGTTFIYVITSENELLHYYPVNNDFGKVGTIGCVPPPSTDAPFSMAVDRKGTAYVLFNSGRLFEVSTADASCKPTTYVPGQHGFTNFGMGFSADITDPGETLFVARDCSLNGVACTTGAECCSGTCAGGACAGTGTGAGSLGIIDPTTLQLTDVGVFSHDIGEAELTGTGAGDLYGFGVEQTGGALALHLAQINKADATILQDTFITLDTNPPSVDAWAFAYYGGDFYFFTATGDATGLGSSIVSKYTPGGTGAPVAKKVNTYTGSIVGAGVSTCAPMVGP